MEAKSWNFNLRYVFWFSHYSWKASDVLTVLESSEQRQRCLGRNSLDELKILFWKEPPVVPFSARRCFLRNLSLDSRLHCPRGSLPRDLRLLRNLRKLEAGTLMDVLHHLWSDGRRSVILTPRLSSLVQLPILHCRNLSTSGNLREKRRAPLYYPALPRLPRTVWER